MTCQSLFSRKNKKNIINLSSAEFAKREGKVKELMAPSGSGVETTCTQRPTTVYEKYDQWRQNSYIKSHLPCPHSAYDLC